MTVSNTESDRSDCFKLVLLWKKKIFFIALTIISIVFEELFEKVFVDCYCYQEPNYEYAQFGCVLAFPSIISYIIALSINESFGSLPLKDHANENIFFRVTYGNCYARKKLE